MMRVFFFRLTIGLNRCITPRNPPFFHCKREWIEFYLESEIADELENVAGTSVYFGAKNLMAYAQLCLVASEIGR